VDLIMRRDIRQLALDAQKIQGYVDVLEQDQEAWARKREANDVTQLIEQAKQLEFNVRIIMSDCLSISCRDSDKELIDDLHQAFACLNTLFNDLKQMRTDLNESYIRPGEIKQLGITSGKFSKTIAQVRMHLEDEQASCESKQCAPIKQRG